MLKYITMIVEHVKAVVAIELEACTLQKHFTVYSQH